MAKAFASASGLPDSSFVLAPRCESAEPMWAVESPLLIAMERRRPARDKRFVHAAAVFMTKPMLSNGRSGPRVIDPIIPQGSACSDTMLCHFTHDVLAHGVGLSKSESDRVYEACLCRARLPRWKARAARAVLDRTPLWYTREDDTWRANSPSMQSYSFWIECTP